MGVIGGFLTLHKEHVAGLRAFGSLADLLAAAFLRKRVRIVKKRFQTGTDTQNNSNNPNNLAVIDISANNCCNFERRKWRKLSIKLLELGLGEFPDSKKWSICCKHGSEAFLG